MAISYENVFFDRCLENIHLLIANEFNSPVYFDKHEGNHSFLITPGEDVLEETVVNGQVRSLTTLISFELRAGGNYTKNSVKQISETIERLKRLLYNNRNYSESGVVKFYNGIVDSVTYERDPDDNNILRGILSFTCTTMELV
jgi:hypothetical protein